MNAVGIVAEYNPFHTGHLHHLTSTRAQVGDDCPVVCAMSGNWTQNARPAVADKWVRARLALLGGADLVLELPTLWAVSSAETFAWGGVSLLAATGVVDTLSFGSELGEVAPLMQAAACLDSSDYARALRSSLDEGLSFAACRQRAVETLLGSETAALLDTPNNNLGVEYLRALRRLGSPITPVTVKREGAAHDSLSSNRPPFRSATDLRRSIAREDWADVKDYFLPEVLALLKEAPRPTADMERAMLAKLRTMTITQWAALPDSGGEEGLPDRLVKAARQARSTEEFFELAKTKRYTHARIRRLALWAFLGLTSADRPQTPPYLRVLGCTPRGRALLKEMKEHASIPILTKPAHVHRLDEGCRALFELESRCTDLYDLCFSPLTAGGREWTTSPVLL